MRALILSLATTAGCAPHGDADYHYAAAQLEAAPACSGCAWAHDVCGEQAKAMTLADIRAGNGLIVCLVWHRQRTAACDESYARCVRTCQP